MAYAAVNSLLYTIDHLLNSKRISFGASTSQTLDFALDRVKSLQGTLRQFDDTRNNSTGVMASEARIRDEARRLEDAIESHVSAQFLSQSLCPPAPTLSLTLEELRGKIDCFAKTADRMEVEYVEELNKPLTEEEDSASADAVIASLGNDFGGSEGEMVGLSDLFLKIRNLLTANSMLRTAVCISGMAGIGKTTLAKKLFHDPWIKATFECRAFVRVEVHDSLAAVSTTRSVLCTGPYHQYQVPICLDWKLLRVLDALTIRFYEFPIEIVKLIQLTYLGLTCDASLPRSISRLWKLSYLIVHRHLSIVDHESYLPVEIWDLQELKHLEIIGRNLPNPPPGAVLPNLRKLLDVGAQSCSKLVLESIPNLRKLRIQIELAADSAQTLSFFDHVSCLEELKSIQCVMVNPELLCEPIVPPPPPLSTAIESLKKLSLSGCGYPWEDMSKIGGLPSLAVLKLRSYAFQGGKWEAKEREFSNLKYLFIEDTDVVQWIAGDGSFPRLRCLTMKHCYNLEEIPTFASDMEILLSPYIVIELVDCNPLAETCADQRYGAQRVKATYSWK